MIAYQSRNTHTEKRFYMKQIYLLLFLLPLLSMSQSKPYFKETIEAYELNKGDTINRKVLVTYLDSKRNVITTENNASNAISGSKSKSTKMTSIKEADTDKLYILTDIDEKGDTISKTIKIFDDRKNVIENYQVRYGDTINRQKRTYNELGKYTKLFNKQKQGNNYYLNIEWEYDEKGNTLQCKTYSEEGKLVGLDKYENIYKDNEFITTKSSYYNGKGFVKIFRETKNGAVTTTNFYTNRTGYNYGIKISQVDGGMSIQENNEEGYMNDLKIFDKKRNLMVHVRKSEIKL